MAGAILSRYQGQPPYMFSLRDESLKKDNDLTEFKFIKDEKQNTLHIFRCPRSQRYFSVHYSEMSNFFDLLEDNVISRFLLWDKCRTLADKYLLAMVFTYFKRAEFNKEQYTRKNFFAALYLAHDMEEEEDDYKQQILTWALKRRKKPMGNSTIMQERDALWKKIDHRAVVSKKCCDEIMAIEPNQCIWQRTRPSHHSGAMRFYLKEQQNGGRDCRCANKENICHRKVCAKKNRKRHRPNGAVAEE